MESKYSWRYCSIGGVTRVQITSGEDVAHLRELDQKMWTVLSCPADGLEMDKTSVAYIDSDHDGKIRVHEVVEAAEWLTSVIKNKDLVLEGNDVLPLDQINTENPVGERLYKSAKQILANLGLDKKEISIADASDSVAIFKNTRFNGDGVIVPATTDDAYLKEVITACVDKMGGVMDRGGEMGTTAEKIEAFYAACADYAAWQTEAKVDTAKILPYGDNTAAALAACEAIKDKVADYFTRCKLLAYDQATATAVGVQVTKLDEISSCPLATPHADCQLPLYNINPAWLDAFNKVRTLVFDVDFPSAKSISESEWNAVLGKFAAYSAWLAAKKGEAVESLGIDKINEILGLNKKDELLALVEQDKALEQESNDIDEVKKLMHLYRDFAKLLYNYVFFKDLYERKPGVRALFEVGQLYIDQRCCDLCFRVRDMGQHADMAKLSGIFLIYCNCVSKALGKTLDIVAVMTDGDTENLRVGKNGIFYDCSGNDWDATITKVVENPISLKEAFWSPYRKAWEFCVNLINKSASDKESKITSSLQSSVQSAADSTSTAATTGNAEVPSGKQQAFDIAKFAGIFAAIGMALGYIGSFFTSLATGIANTPGYKLLMALVAIILIISGPSCFIAWMKLRKRNLGPVLNANGWAINSKVLINIMFGGRLTSVAKYPKLRVPDPYVKKKSPWPAIIIVLLLAAGCAASYHFYFKDKWFHKEKSAVTATTDSTKVKSAVSAETTVAAAPADSTATVSE